MYKNIAVFLTAIFLSTLAACTPGITVIPADENAVGALSVTTEGDLENLPSAAPTLEPPRVLSICMGQEPASLFLYGDETKAAQSIRQAIYDGPFNIIDNEISSVILKKIPSLSDGDVYLRPVEVVPGTLILDGDGNWVNLQDGVNYLPVGCSNSECSQIYAGQEPIQMDEMVVQFEFLPGIQWSDGAPLTASDSVYSFSVFKALFEDYSPERLRYTRSYQAIDELTLEWVGIPGFRGDFISKVFSPLPKHLWENISPPELFSHDLSSRTPLGWGPYIIDEWTVGDHISLNRNPNYFKNESGSPFFDHLVFRFMESGTEAIDALLVGECDYIDQTALSEADIPRLQENQNSGNLAYALQLSQSWELAAFGIDTLSVNRFDIFEAKATRQAIAHCIDRQAIVGNYLYAASVVPDTYLSPSHPLVNPDVKKYDFDPAAAAALFTIAGWVDFDANPETPLTASGISGIPDGTPLTFTYSVPKDAERPAVAAFIAEGLRQCGVGVEVVESEWGSLFAAGPEGPVFGRQFDMVQFAWATSLAPPCFLFMSDEIPGEYPEHAKGWGGSNLSGYQNSELDQSCRQANRSIPGSDSYLSAHYQAQLIFSEELPVIPLYQRINLIATRPDFCGISENIVPSDYLSNIENFDYGNHCQ